MNRAAGIVALQNPSESGFIRLFCFPSVETEIRTKHISDLRGENTELLML
jgi:hypothetical protein